MSKYPNYLRDCKQARASINCSTLSFPELAHIIEKAEREIYIKGRNLSPEHLKAKQFRHNYAIERKRVCRQIKSVWQQVNAISSIVEAPVSLTVLNSAMSRLPQQCVDGYDLLILETMANVGIECVITDDGDYATVPGITVFTANKAVIQAAKQQGQLKSR
ncbi:MAG: hypothetical protein ACPGVO_00270 [Spirulinaceae cyanobacterium]